MIKKITAFALIGILALGTVFMTSCGQKKDEKKSDDKKKTFVVGLDDTFAPMGFRDKDGKLVGFDIDLAKKVAKECRYKIKFKPIDWNAKEAELKAGTIDCVWNGMSATPERKKKMALSAKYLDNKIVLMKEDKSDKEVKSAQDLKDMKIGTQEDSSALEMLKSNKDYDLFKDNITEYPTYDAAIMDLKAGRVDVIAVDQVLGNYQNQNLGGELAECEYVLGNDYYVIGFAKDNEKLCKKVNKALEKLVKDGTTEKISKKWFGKNIAVYEAMEK